MGREKRKAPMVTREPEPEPEDPRIKPDWSRDCDNCGERPIVPMTGMCGPCTFGEAETMGGNW